jgi:hypothetical protein
MIKDILTGIAASFVYDLMKSTVQPSAEVGKITDTLPIKPGSRVSEYWADKFELIDYTGRRKRLKLGEANATDVCLRFGLHSIEFGNWVNENERQNALVAIDESLSDLAAVIGAPHHAIGLNNTLAIAYGARGKGGSHLAHYSPGQVLINITKNKGAGSLAHEYGHAIDYHMGVNWMRAPSSGRALHRNLNHLNQNTAHGMMERAFAPVFRRADGQPTAWIQNLERLPEYWQRRNEIWARMFEQWVAAELKKRGDRNHFLTDSTYYQPAYLTPALLDKASPHILRYARIALGAEALPSPSATERARGKKAADAIVDILKTKKYKTLAPTGASLLWSTWSQDPDTSAEPNNEKLEQIIMDELLYKFVKNDRTNSDAYLLNRAGRDFLEAVQGRLQTFQHVARGEDLFPDDAGIAGGIGWLT